METTNEYNKEQLIDRLTQGLPDIRDELSITNNDLENMTNIRSKRIDAIEGGRQQMRWSEYLSIVFVLWSNDAGKGILDKKGLFPPEMRRAFSINNNAHS